MDKLSELRKYYPADMPLPANIQLKTAAHILGISRPSVYNLDAAGEIIIEKLLGRAVVPAESLNALLARRAGNRKRGKGNGGRVSRS